MSNQIHERVIERVRKLFALAQSSNEHEARSAANMASKLLIEHNLSAAEVEAKKEYGEAVVDTYGRIMFYQRYIVNLVRLYFFVEVYSSRARTWQPDRGRYSGKTSLMIVGTPVNVKIATFVYEFLSRKYQELWDEYQKETECPADHKQAYMIGLTNGLGAQLKATRSQVQEEKGLVIVRDGDLTKFMEEKALKKGSQSKEPAALDRQAYEAGAEQGKNLRIAQGIEAPENKSPTLAIKS